MDDTTRRIVYVIMSITLSVIMVLFAVSAIHIMWRDGNDPLVQSVTNSIMWVLVSGIGGIAAVVIGKDISTGLLTHTTTTVTTASPTIVTTQATVVKKPDSTNDQSTIAPTP